MLSLLLIMIVVVVALTAFLWGGTFLFQGYIYLQPSQQLFWQAPAAACVLTFGYAIWCFSIAASTGANPQNVPIDTIFRFSPTFDMLDRPVPKIWAVKRDRKKSAAELNEEILVPYVCVRDNQKEFHYVDTTLTPRPWQPQDVIAIQIEKADGTKMRFNLAPTEPGQYRQFVSPDGWAIKEFATGPTGLPVRFSYGRLFWNLVFNVCHGIAWFACLWLLLRFQPSHALGLAAVIWLLVTLAILPMLLSYSAHVANLRHSTTIMRPQAPG